MWKKCGGGGRSQMKTPNKYIFKCFLSDFWVETKYEQDRPHPTEINRLLLCTDFTTADFFRAISRNLSLEESVFAVHTDL